MIRSIALSLLLAAAVPVVGQTAKVIALTPEDAKQAQSLYAQKKEIEDKIATFHDSIRKKYTQETLSQDQMRQPGVACVVNLAGTCIPAQYMKVGWENGFLFSEDFKFIVPDLQKPVTSVDPCWTQGIVWNGYECIWLTDSPQH